MGWSSGTDIARAVIEAVHANVPDAKTRLKIYKPSLKAMEESDWGTQDESADIDPIWDKLIGFGD